MQFIINSCYNMNTDMKMSNVNMKEKSFWNLRSKGLNLLEKELNKCIIFL